MGSSSDSGQWFQSTPPVAGGRCDDDLVGREVGDADRLQAADAVDAGRNLLPKVLNAEYCARLLFDQEGHDRMLADVMAADANVPGLTLSNTIAKRRAAELVESGKDYF